MSRATARCASLLLPLLLLGGCGEGDSHPNGVVVRDSAGVTIVERSEAAWAEGEGWSLAGEPLVRIGAVEGDPDYLFDRINSAAFLSDGRIVVADPSRAQLRLFDEEGRAVGAWGGPGEGPGEFGRLGQVLVLPGDTVIAWDFVMRRVTRFAPDGSLIGTVGPLGGGGAPVMALHPLEGGGYLTLPSGVSSTQLQELIPGLWRFPTSVLRLASDGAVVDTVGTFAGDETIVTERSFGMVPFGKRLGVAGYGDGLWVAEGERAEVRFLRADGSVERIVRFPVEVRPLDDAVLARFIDEVTDPGPDMELPETLPLFGGLRVDGEGVVWLAPYTFGAFREGEWRAIHPEEGYLGVVEVPDAVTVLEVLGSRALTVWTDELGVPYLEMRRVEGR